jgi:LHFPL tetraspan subfamily member protein
MISVIWSIFTVFFAILNIFIFLQPYWIGDSLSSSRTGHFGLYSYCIGEIDDYELDCLGNWFNFNHILNIPFAIATIAVGISILLILICLVYSLFLICCCTQKIYFICALLQGLCAFCLLTSIIIYPSGFDNDTIRDVCGNEVQEYYLDTCQIRWAYILAIIGFFNVCILAIVALFLAIEQRQSRLMHEVINPLHITSKYNQLTETFDERTLTESNRSPVIVH